MSVQSSPSDLVAQLRALPESERFKIIDSFTDDEAEALLHDWELWARAKQLAPEEFADGSLYSLWLVMAGRGFGKTRVGAEQVRAWIRAGYTYVNCIAATADDLRDVIVEGESGILACCTRAERPIYRVSKRRLEWPNGAISLLFTAEEPDRLRGKQHQKLWADEVAAWRYAEDSWDQAMFGLRLGDCPQTVATTTPRPTKIIRQLMAEKTTVVTRGTTYENRENLAPTFYSKIITKYEGTRLGRQELNAEVLDDNPNALWKRSNIDANRVKVAPPLSRIVVAIDPAVTSKPDSDETGIIIAGRDGRFPPHFYVLDDKSFIGTPDEWAQMAVNAFEVHLADRVVGETNNGGDLIETVLRHKNANIAYSKVTASRGKTIRAEPAAALYEQNRVHHVGSFAVLEDQCCDWNPQDETQDSPDRMDALVWALTELANGTDSFAEFVKGEAKAMSAAGVVQPSAAAKVNVDGTTHERCECGSVVWNGNNCFKCGKARPE